MALPLNRYRTVFTTSLSSSSDTEVYQAPVGYNAVLLAVNACNTGVATKDVTIKYRRENPFGTVNLVDGFQVPAKDSADLTTGKIIIEQNDSILARATDSAMHLTISILETKI